MAEYNATDRIGVNAVEGIFIKDFGWIFREQPISDMGIDAHTEIVHDGSATGKLISLQIKTGKSHFTIDEESLTYYGSLRHLDYWTNHSLPVLLVAHLPETNETYWELVVSKNIVRTKKAWKIIIPKQQKLDSSSLEQIAKIGDGTDEIIKKRKLIIDRPLMELIRNGGKVSVEFMEWINKSLNRTPIKIIIAKRGKETIIRQWGVAYAGYEPTEIYRLIFPWAAASIDEDFYELNLDEDSLRSMYSLEWLYNKGIYPYRVQMCEVADYRIQLNLNQLGEGFLHYMDYIERGEVF